MIENTDSTSTEPKRLLERRTVVKTAAWSVPAIALAVAAPAYAASAEVNVGAFQLNGSCGTLGVLGPGFTLQAGDVALPVGTSITITGSGVADIGVFSVTGGTANVAVLSGTSRQITLTSEVPANAMIAFRSTLSITVAFTLNGLVALPSGYTSTGAKPSGSVSSTLILCSAT